MYMYTHLPFDARRTQGVQDADDRDTNSRSLPKPN